MSCLCGGPREAPTAFDVAMKEKATKNKGLQIAGSGKREIIAANSAQAELEQMDDLLFKDLGCNEDVCCLAWQFSEAEESSLEDRDRERIRKLHEEIVRCAPLYFATIIEQTATAGVLMCRERIRQSDQLSMEDRIVLLGQCIGQYCLDQPTPIGIFLGAHTGLVSCVDLGFRCMKGYYGEAVSVSKKLAANSPQESCVHLLRPTKCNLLALECLQFHVASYTNSYYLEPGVKAEEEVGHQKSRRIDKNRSEDADHHRVNGSKSMTKDQMSDFLKDHHIDVSLFSAESLELLHDEIQVSKMSRFQVEGGELMRCVKLARVWLCAVILSCEHTLVHKCKFSNGTHDDRQKDSPLTLRICPKKDWREGVQDVLIERLGLDVAFQKKCLTLEESGARVCEEIKYSDSYPGLKTLYRIHEVKVHVIDPHEPAMERLGLPDGTDYIFGVASRRNTLARRSSNTVTIQWCWKPFKEIYHVTNAQGDSVSKADSIHLNGQPDPKRTLPTPARLTTQNETAVCVVEDLMQGKIPNWDRARNAAKMIREKEYSLKMFYDDCVAAFPELSLYVFDLGGDSISGNTLEEEYNRTIGALFAVYWLMRLHLDGAKQFCFGVNDEWQAVDESSGSPVRDAEETKKRKASLEAMKWGRMQQVFIDAGLLETTGDPPEVIGHNVERTLGMLVLTAVHDIMKVGSLLPIVQDEHEPFCDFQAGERIGDHDIALAYIFEHYPTALPSYNLLPTALKDSVKFTQSKMEYNMGWLVQAEAPPGALFKKFKEIVMGGLANPEDVAFYFTHWLTDLSGAEPFPQEGCEKFVLKFPQKVLLSFLDSFPIVKQLSSNTETEVYEKYLQWRWTTHEPSLGNLPRGPGSIAKMRIVIMAQGDSKAFLGAFDSLSAIQASTLSKELALTGCEGQVFSSDSHSDGPAFLVYYGPALLQKAGAVDPVGALVILTDVLAKARQLFPPMPSQQSETVSIRIDSLKGLSTMEINQIGKHPGDVWILEKTSSKDAAVRKANLMTDLPDWTTAQVLFTEEANLEPDIGFSVQLGATFSKNVPSDAASAFVKKATLRRLGTFEVSSPLSNASQ